MERPLHGICWILAAAAFLTPLALPGRHPRVRWFPIQTLAGG